MLFFGGSGPLSINDAETPARYGLVADGNSHPLSDFYGTLEGAQAAFNGALYFITSLGQEADWAACKATSNAAFGGDLELITAYEDVTANSAANTIIDTTQNWVVNQHAGRTAFRKFASNGFVDSAVILANTENTLTLVSDLFTGAPVSVDDGNTYAIGYGEHGSVNARLNKPIYLPGGRYWFGNDTWRIRNLSGGKIVGAGKRSAILTGSATVQAFDGIWYSALSDYSVECQTDDATAAMEIDGNIPGHDYETRGVQGVTLMNMLIDGGGSDHALTMCRLGGSAAQGSECLFPGLHLSNARVSVYFQNGFNALANTFIGGNCQNYQKDGLSVAGGTIAVFNMGFQSQSGYKQIENGGADISVGSSGAYEACSIYGCRTESLRFLNNVGSVNCDVRAVRQRVAIGPWSPGTTFGPSAPSYKAIFEDGRLFVATTPGTTHASVEPDWTSVADGGTVSDNDIVWTHIVFNSIYNGYGSVDRKTVIVEVGNIAASAPEALVSVDTDYQMVDADDAVFMECLAAPRTVVLPVLPDQSLALGKVVEISKTDVSSNALTIEPGTETIHGGSSPLVIAGGSRGTKRLRFGIRGQITPATWMDVG